MNSSRRMGRVRVAAGAAGLALVLAGCVVTNPPDVYRVTDPGDGRSGQIGGDDANGGVKLRNFLVVSDGSGKPGTLVGAVTNQTGKDVQVGLTILQTGPDGQQSRIGTTNVTVKPTEYVQFGDPAGGTGGTAAPTGAPASPTPTPTPTTSIGSDTTYTPSPRGSASSPGDIGSEPATGRVVNFRIPAVTQPAGAVLLLEARTADGGGTTIELPILPPVGEYAYLAPKAPGPAGPTGTSSPTTASPSASPTASPSGTVSPSADTSGAATQSPTATP